MNKPLGNLINIYIILVLIAIVAGIMAIFFDSFWLFIITLITIPIFLKVLRLLGFAIFITRPMSTFEQISREVVAPIFKSKLILILIATVVAYFFIVRWYIQQ